MLKFIFLSVAAILFILSCGQSAETGFHAFSHQITDSATGHRYCWQNTYDLKNNLVNRIPVPEGYRRVKVSPASFEDWLRHLPLKKEGTEVKLFNGTLKSRQDVHAAVIDMDAGNEDLQQCADACMRLKAEYHFSKKDHSSIRFRFTSGDVASWKEWIKGYRPVISGNKVSWIKKALPDSSYKNFRNYMSTVFRYAGTQSLSQECRSIEKKELRAGDIFIKGGFPGHAVIVTDVAENVQTGEKLFLIAQSYMPAQEVHILRNFNNPKISPWYTNHFTSELSTPEWTFYGSCLKRFP